MTYSSPEDALDELLHGSVFDGEPMPDADSSEVASAIAELRETGVDFIVLAPDAPLLPGDDGEYAEFLDTAVGDPIFADEGVRVYQLGQ